ncbi:MAG: Txe/YoeB family addiction module toxin [Flavobacteriales bacterium]|nr:Txe/YoeB family addiction module toxin [Flavobacteriales bacterium]
MKAVKKIYSVLENTCKNPFEGLGQPEPLKANYSGYWSRRINKEHRIVYKVEDNAIVVHSLYGHYN